MIDGLQFRTLRWGDRPRWLRGAVRAAGMWPPRLAHPWPFVLSVSIGSRALSLLVGAASGSTTSVPARLLPQHLPAGTPLGQWATWDGAWYAAIASQGYSPEHLQVVAFFPLYPLLVRLVTYLVPAVAASGVLVSLLSFVAGSYFLYELVRQSWGERVARGTVLCLAFFPTAFYFNAVYSESLFLALSAGALWAARVRRNLLLACLLAGLATATRSVGLVLVIPLAVEWLRWRGRPLSQGAYLAIVPVGLLCYMGYLWVTFGDPVLFVRQESSEWSRHLTSPDVSLTSAVSKGSAGTALALSPDKVLGNHSFRRSAKGAEQASDTYNLIALAFVLVVALVGAVKLPLGLSVYGALVILPPLLFASAVHPLLSFPRFALVDFPLFIVLGMLLANRWALAAWLIASGGASVYLCSLFVSWRWLA